MTPDNPYRTLKWHRDGETGINCGRVSIARVRFAATSSGRSMTGRAGCSLAAVMGISTLSPSSRRTDKALKLI